MFLLIFRPEDGVAHGGLGGDGNHRQHVVGRLVRLAPQQVVVPGESVGILFDVPVAIGREDGVELQAFGLVYREDADAVHLARRDGGLREGLVPVGQERAEVGRVVLQVVREAVEVGEQIGVLAGDACQSEESVEFLLQLVQGEGAQRVQLPGEAFREQGFQVFPGQLP